MFSTILFDLDGTIMNTAQGITNGVKYALEKYGMEPLDYETRKRFIGPPIRDSFIKYSGVDDSVAEELLTLYREFYSKEGLLQCEPYEGIEELLSDLRRQGRTLYVATAKPTPYSKAILDHWKLSKYFKEIVGAGFDKNFETKDKIVKYVCEIAEDKNVIMVGDTCFDVYGAKAAGIPCIGVLYGFGDHEELYASKPEYIAETVSNIRRFV